MQLPQKVQGRKADLTTRIIAGIGDLAISFSVLLTIPYDIKEYVRSKINKSYCPMYFTKDHLEMAQECEYILLKGKFPSEEELRFL